MYANELGNAAFNVPFTSEGGKTTTCAEVVAKKMLATFQKVDGERKAELAKKKPKKPAQSDQAGKGTENPAAPVASSDEVEMHLFFCLQLLSK